MTIDVGSTVGDYQVVAVLGAGGMGKVFKVRNVISDRIEAMKVLLPDLTGEPDLADRFLREIKVLASLSHPNIANLHTALRVENQLLMLMEFVEGVTLEDRLKQGRLPFAEAAGYIGQALSALSYAHQRGVVHRDMKPANMMLTANGVVKLMDFGIAKSAADRKLTMTGTTMGSMYYMSPEQIRGAQTLDSRSDLYSLGVSLYQLVTGQRPFDGDSQFSIMSAHLEKDPKPPISLDPSLPASLNEVILMSVQREPERRFQTAEAFHKALANAVVPVGAIPQPAPVAKAAAPGTAPARPKSRRGMWVAVGAVCAVAALVAVLQFSPPRKADAGAASPTAAPAVPAAVSPAPSQPAPAQPIAEPSPAAAPVASSPEPVRTTPPARPQAGSQPSLPRRAVAGSTTAASQPAQPPAATPAQAQPAPAPSVQQAPPQPQPQPPDASIKRAELQKIRESLAQLSARANGIHNTLQSLQRSQAASGLGLRRDWVEAAGLMDSFIRGAADALNAGDGAAAQDLMGKAEIQVDKLDKALK